MMRVNILVPAIKVGLLLPPRTFERTRFFDPLIEFHASDKIQQTTATQEINYGVFVRAGPDRRFYLHEIGEKRSTGTLSRHAASPV